jgi:DNA repair protein RadC
MAHFSVVKTTAAPEERQRVTSPADAANLLMSEMMLLEKEHMRLVLLDTRNHVLKTPTVYVGSLNTSVVRIGELFRDAIKENAAAMIVAHNHPSGTPRSVSVSSPKEGPTKGV